MLTFPSVSYEKVQLVINMIKRGLFVVMFDDMRFMHVIVKIFILHKSFCEYMCKKRAHARVSLQ
jgi:hypothetical protein